MSMRSNRVSPFDRKTGETFGAYARVYDLLNNDNDYEGECVFVHGLLQELSPESKDLLELGCGTGAHSAHFAGLGYHVCGIDLSKQMLEQATLRMASLPEELRSRVQLLHGDLRSLSLKRRYEAIVALFHVFNYQITSADLKAALQTIKTCLAPDGVFLFDCLYGPALLHRLPERRVKCAQNEQLTITLTTNPTLFPNENRVDVIYDITVRNKLTGIEENIQECHRLRYLFIPEIEELCSSVGLTVLSVNEWMTNNQPSLSSRSVFVFGRAE